VLTLEHMFALADENSKTLKRDAAAVAEAQQGVMVAKSGYLPDIGISLSANYLGNGHLTDRDFAPSATRCNSCAVFILFRGPPSTITIFFISLCFYSE
jgi:outer membrane protein TolC